jgi:hypothetical protein
VVQLRERRQQDLDDEKNPNEAFGPHRAIMPWEALKWCNQLW